MVSEYKNNALSAVSSRGIDGSQLNLNISKNWTPLKLELTVKLDHNNFLIWRQQVLTIIKGNRLVHFVDSSIPPPNRVDPDGSVREEFLDWEQQDQILLCWLLSSLKLQLQTLKKGNLSMTEYLMKKNNFMDALTYTGYAITEEDKIIYVLSGLWPEYDSFVIPTTSMQNYYIMPKITAFLLMHEARIEQHSQTETLNVNMAANRKGNGNNQKAYGRGQSQNCNNGSHQNQGGENFNGGQNFNGGRR
ncbi:hypothetical protein Ddye_028333 [Dipteronia dyeriana]|uniref:Retrotransposon Copia-like N-terminal domain-containing protein n=1 Tax=Dipteronia dyeriana TaxID=168575 RepID=A0AAD9TRQ5_9ROSI|nr:hypothetical protein Ddye_028333 [Dipteronia dyeriana]